MNNMYGYFSEKYFYCKNQKELKFLENNLMKNDVSITRSLVITLYNCLNWNTEYKREIEQEIFLQSILKNLRNIE